ncbi:glycosyl hydrolases family 35-domain-containing protein [Chaetomium tenue]|uniref:Glycosyl hydrolases family 35-domain-containing protein n=1 Tax=Chaetomium tenue TaxID=1854479 RepID=A0ACB7P1T6_9PEZI|nr:glycosyl hydrolases family 35-domain-containing protein [Chaetomium globosum]
MYASSVWLGVGAWCLASAGAFAAAGSFTWDRNNFYLNDAKYTIIGGQIDPQRVPREYWGQRLQMAKAMGLNTIFSYLYWQDIEPYPGQFDFTGMNDVAAWHQAIKDAGMKAVLRPGPYVCAERDWGGLPGWLNQIPNMKIRSNNAPFLNASAKYLAKVGEQLRDYLVTNDGPILLVQVENEYGYVGNDMNYKRALSDALFAAFPKIKQYTNDGASALKSGYLPGALSVVDGSGPKNGIPERDKAITDPTSLGPLMDGEVWITWFDTWGPKSGHAGAADASGDIDWMLSQGYHFSIYMFHGGTSFGFGGGSGGGSPNPITPFTTSYDYGAVLDETGRPASTYSRMRSAIAKHIPASSIPAIPSLPPLQSIPSFPLTPFAPLFPTTTTTPTNPSDTPLPMEALNQTFGLTLYTHTATTSSSGALTLTNGPRDRVIVYVNGARKGVLDGIYRRPATVNVALQAGDVLGLLVENLGRVDNGFTDQRKGVVGDVAVGGRVLRGGWGHVGFGLGFGGPEGGVLPEGEGGDGVVVREGGEPVWYKGVFANGKEGMAADTFLELPGGVKGVVFVNGHNLGRYWTIGPQQQLFVPGAWLKETNEVLVLELEPKPGDRVARGLAVRTWGNNPDPDCNGCS